MKKQINEIKEVMAGLFSIPSPSIGIDIDGVIDEAPIFLVHLGLSWVEV